MPKYPALYQVNTRVWLTEIGRRLGRPATLDDLPDEALDQVAARGFDWVWFLGVWQTGEAGCRVSRSHPEWQAEFRHVLPDLTDDDIAGSCFAVTGYEASPQIGGEAALRRLRQRLAARGLRLMLDFVPNHVALDHPWTRMHPDWLVRGSDDDLARQPRDWCRVVTPDGSQVFAHGRDPYFPAWPDTLQLNYAHPELRAAMRGELLRIAERCDGVRCDMAMLVLPEVFKRTWHLAAEPFWPVAIAAVREAHPGFYFMAEVYWDLEWQLLQQGFDYAYDKGLYDRLRARDAGSVRDHLIAGLDFQSKLARFLENHDEPRAATVFPREVHAAAAVITYLAPGLRFFHQGQLEGRRIRVPTHLVRAPEEPDDGELAAVYARLLDLLRRPALRDGRWWHLEPLAGWAGNDSWDGFVAFAWRGSDGERLVVAVNYADSDGQCHLRLPFPEIADRQVRLRDLLGPESYEREGRSLITPGLYLDMPAWGHHVFLVESA